MVFVFSCPAVLDVAMATLNYVPAARFHYSSGTLTFTQMCGQIQTLLFGIMPLFNLAGRGGIHFHFSY